MLNKFKFSSARELQNQPEGHSAIFRCDSLNRCSEMLIVIFLFCKYRPSVMWDFKRLKYSSAGGWVQT